ncbi:MAG: glycoside hydrolase family 3 C-terminal domain-containing protein [Clostridia bacterium]|nr:glycoside hydrolase family 3 C-terminal domain-containing protein [Clostridia bacterium]
MKNLSRAAETAKKLVDQMTVEEKLSQLLYNSPAIPRLGIHEYNWWNEAAHGVARAGIATVFPQAIGMAASFHPELVREVADAVSTEARAKYNKSVEFEDYDIFKGLTFWTPNINIFRDPRWGRGQETFGEDPYLTATMGVSYIRGLQGEGEFLKSAACAKHFAVHSGPESLRHGFDAEVGMKDLWETYLPAFEKAVEAGVAGVMGAYNRTNGEPCCAHSYLIEEVLRKMWGFAGYFVSDCGAIADIAKHHHCAEDMKGAAALSLKKGCELNCGEAYTHLVEAWEEDLIGEEEITAAATRLYTIRALLGEFEEVRPYADIPYDVLDCEAHRRLNDRIAEESLVLLQNADNFLPLGEGKYKKIAVVGPNGNSTTVLEGNYNGRASEYITVAEGMRRVFPDARITVANGSNLYRESRNNWGGFGDMHSEGLAAASEAEVTVLCLGMDRTVEGEEIPGLDDDCFDHGDKRTLKLPKTQLRLAEKVCEVCENVIFVIMCGSPIDLGDKLLAKAKAVIHAWYPGARGGLAIARLLRGEFSPSGRLPMTFAKAETALPAITSYAMEGRTYRYREEEPRYPFGFGLGYTKFRYSGAEILEKNENAVRIAVSLANVGGMKAAEKVQVYARMADSRTSTPVWQLCGLSSVELAAGETGRCEISIDRYWLKAVLADGSRVEPDGGITLCIGGHQPDARSAELTGTECISLSL